MKRLVFFFFLFALTQVTQVFGQEDSLHDSDAGNAQKVKYDEAKDLVPLPFEESKIESFKNSKDFEYIEEKQEKTWWQEFKEWLNYQYNRFLKWFFGDYDAGSFFGFIIRILPYLLLLGILILVLWLFTRINPGKNILESKPSAMIAIPDDEEIIQNADIPALIKNAIENGQYRLAVRYYYLQALKELDIKNRIEFASQKTNNDYLSEIQDPKLSSTFSKVTRIYNFIWYGDFQVSKDDFLLAQKGFAELEEHLKTAGNE